MSRFVLVERFQDGAEKDHDLAPYSDPNKAFRALMGLMSEVPAYYGGCEPVRKLLVLERAYEPRHGPLPKRRPGATYGLADARTEPVESEHHVNVETLEAT